MSSNVCLVSQEGDKFDIPKTVAMMSELVNAMIEEYEDDEDVQEIPLINVKNKVLVKVIEFCKYHTKNGPMKEIEKPLKSPDMKEIVSAWDADFVQIEQEMLYDIILAANYMDIKSLLDLTCARVASMIKGKSPEEIRKTFGIDNDFTPEEEVQVRKDNKWCEEV
jgi:S-phase kinase-associated protein 1